MSEASSSTAAAEPDATTEDTDAVIELLEAVRQSDAEVDTSEFRVARGQYDDRLVATAPNDDPDQFQPIMDAARSVGWEVKDYDSGIGRIGIPRLKLEFVPQDVPIILDTAQDEGRDEPGQCLFVSWIDGVGGSARKVRDTGYIVDPADLEEGDEVWVDYGDVRKMGGYRYRTYSQKFHASVDRVTDTSVELDNGTAIRLDSEACTGDPLLEGKTAGETQAARTVVRLS